MAAMDDDTQRLVQWLAHEHNQGQAHRHRSAYQKPLRHYARELRTVCQDGVGPYYGNNNCRYMQEPKKTGSGQARSPSR
jgi:hypothetical protein